MKVGSTGFLLSSAAQRLIKGGLQPEKIQGQPPLLFGLQPPSAKGRYRLSKEEVKPWQREHLQLLSRRERR